MTVSISTSRLARSGRSIVNAARYGAAAAAFLSLGALTVSASAQQALGYANSSQQFWLNAQPSYSQPSYSQPSYSSSSAPIYSPAAITPSSSQEDALISEDAGVPDRLQRQVVAFDSREAPGTVVIDTRNTHLYYVLGQNRAIRYGVGVGREGFTWAGVQSVSRKAEWPDWTPPSEMIARQPYLPRFMAGGAGNPLGARAMYLGSSTYRIHGTNDPSTIGKFVSSGCIRLTNEDVTDLFNRVSVGAKVVVLPKSGREQIESNQAQLMPAVPKARLISVAPAAKPVTKLSTRTPAPMKISGL